MQEIFKDIPGYEEIYQVSNLGNVKSLERFRNNNHSGYIQKEKILKTSFSATYLCCRLSKNGKTKTLHIHKLVAMAFLNHIPNGHKIVVDHIDSNKLNNNLSNLRLISHRENVSKEKSIKSGLPTGVHFHKKQKKYTAYITIDKKINHLGSFNTIEEASNAYQNKLNQII
jgi:hypothetical protein